MDESTNTGAGYGGAAGSEGVGGGSEQENAGNRFSRAYGAASEKVRDGYNAMRERVDDVDVGAISDQVRTYVRSNPGKALLISVGVGFLIGLLLRGDDDED